MADDFSNVSDETIYRKTSVFQKVYPGHEEAGSNECSEKQVKLTPANQAVATPLKR